MQSAPLPPNEAMRLEALRESGILDSPPEEAFDRLTQMAARICGAPIALITLVDVDRQWLKSRIGLEGVEETPRNVAFCAHAILQDDVMVIPDALQDQRFHDNPLVQQNPKIRFYAGSPMVIANGQALGTLCVIDNVPRRLDDEQVDALRALSQHAAAMIELRRTGRLVERLTARWAG